MEGRLQESNGRAKAVCFRSLQIRFFQPTLRTSQTMTTEGGRGLGEATLVQGEAGVREFW